MSQKIKPVYLALGSNLGDRLRNIAEAISMLSSQVEVRRVSRIYETEPWGFREQPRFLNQVFKGHTMLAPLDLLHFLKDVESHLGRTSGPRYGPRIIDIDILFYAKTILNSSELCIPHPRLAERAFVLIPLVEIAPRFKHPILGKTMREIANQVNPAGIFPFEGR